ncbi:MAG: GNAT family N-acetyltransferase [Gammaproteobacteria bacterium]|nr:GNAT family N-acetyltransferase [Gammaproteobacteria bacterium]
MRRRTPFAARRALNAGEAAVIRWEWLAFAQLDCRRLHAVLAARAAVFVVEQNCAYQDIDGLDAQAWHLMGWHRDDTLAAYLRVLPPGAKFPEHCIGRVLVSAAFRGHSLGRELMLRGLAHIEESFGPMPLRLCAQSYLEAFYASLGFVSCSDRYLEDGIEHVDMLRAPGLRSR